MDLELHEIIPTLNALKSIQDQSEKIVTSSCGELLEHLLKLDFDDQDDKYYLYHFSYNDLPAIRVYGHFINLIVISKSDEDAWSRIRLGQACEDEILYFGEYKTDEYHTGDEDGYIYMFKDIAPYLDLLESLKIIFKETENYLPYCNFVKRTKEKSRNVLDAISLMGDFSESLELCMKKLFACHPNYDYRVNGFFLFPNNMCLRYRGYYHNCIGSDGYSISLGYIKDPNKFYTIEEDAYNMDSYTIQCGANRYQELKSIHNLKTLDVTIYNIWESVRILRQINKLLIDDLKKGNLQFIRLDSIIDYRKRRL